MKVYELIEDGYEGQGFGLFATRQLAEAEIVRLALAQSLPKLSLDEREVQEGES